MDVVSRITEMSVAERVAFTRKLAVKEAQAAYWARAREMKHLPMNAWRKAHEESATLYHAVLRAALEDDDATTEDFSEVAEEQEEDYEGEARLQRWERAREEWWA